MTKSKRGWHIPAQHIESPQEGKCPYCNKHVNSLKDHVHDKHKDKKLVKK